MVPISDLFKWRILQFFRLLDPWNHVAKKLTPPEGVGWYVLALSVRKRTFLRTKKANPKHCENWRRESSSEFHKISPMCERGERRKQLQDLLLKVWNKPPLAPVPFRVFFWSDGDVFKRQNRHYVFVSRIRLLSCLQFNFLRSCLWSIDRFDPSSGRTFPTILSYFLTIPHPDGTAIANIAVLSTIAHIHVLRSNQT